MPIDRGWPIDDDEKQLMAATKRTAELEAALNVVLAWAPAIETCAPELGGCLSAMWRARDVLARPNLDALAELQLDELKR